MMVYEKQFIEKYFIGLFYRLWIRFRKG